VATGNSGQWAKGVSGNPAGRPKGSGLMNILGRELEKQARDRKGQPILIDGESVTYGELLVQRLITGSIETGDSSLLRLVFSYAEGLPAQKIEARFVEEQRPDFSRLSNQELKQALALAEKANGEGALPGDD